MTTIPSRSQSSRRRTRGLAFAAAGVVTVLSLSGCLSMTANLTIDSEAQTSGTFAIGLQKQAAGMLGMKDLDTFSSGITSPDVSSGTGDLLTTSDCTASETDTEFVYTCALSDAELTSKDNPWTVTKDGDSITFHMVNQATAEQNTDELLQGGSLGALTVNVTFPGEITSVSGDFVTKKSDTSITVSAALSDAVDVTVVSKSSASGGMSTVIVIIAIAVIAIILIALIAFLVTRRKSDEPPAIVAGDGAPVAIDPVDGTAVLAVDPAPVQEAPAAAEAPTEIVEPEPEPEPKPDAQPS